nr:MAG TPA: dUTPase [Caudoviricetes sp.]
MLPVLKIKKLIEKATVPKAMTEGSCGLDVAVSEPVTFFPNRVTKVHTGLAMAIPKGYHIEVHIRSSWGKRGIRLANCTGIIDSDYRGELKLLLINDTTDIYYAPEGERIAQLILVKDPAFTIKEVDELDETKRGKGGFGSTNKENKGDK